MKSVFALALIAAVKADTHPPTSTPGATVQAAAAAAGAMATDLA